MSVRRYKNKKSERERTIVFGHVADLALEPPPGVGDATRIRDGTQQQEQMLIGCSGRYGHCCYVSGGSSSLRRLRRHLFHCRCSVGSGAAAPGGGGGEGMSADAGV